jgi:hypothetical protein
MKKDEIEILLENIQEKFDLVLEGHTKLTWKLDRMAADMNQRMDELAQKIQTIEQKTAKPRSDRSKQS